MTPNEISSRLEALARHNGNYAAAARELGIARSTLQETAARHRTQPEYIAKGTSELLDASGNVIQRWDKTRLRGRPDWDVQHVPDPKTVTSISTLYDQLGEVAQQWVTEKPQEAARRELWEEWAKALAEDLPRAAPVQMRGQPTRSDLMAAYPVGDHHLGMLAWAKETGADYDIDIATRLLEGAMAHLVDIAPPCEEAAVIFLGDFCHYDSFDTVTPTSKNQLDADGRFPKMVRAAIRLMRRTIELAAAKHERVRVIVETGNHDLAASIFLMEALHNIYEDNLRIEVDTSPRHFHYFTFGKCLIGTHHGHGVKPERLPQVMSTDRREDWGRAEHCYWWTGHIHTQTFFDYPGCSVESFRILAPNDAWAANKGYRSRRDMKSIILSKEHGEVARNVVNPQMVIA